MRGLGIRFASVVGGPLGGLAVAVGGAATAFAFAGLLIAISVPLLVSVRIREVPGDGWGAGADGDVALVVAGARLEKAGARALVGSAWDDLRVGLRYIRRHRVLAPLICGPRPR